MDRDCTCLGTCKGAAGLAPGWVCALATPVAAAWRPLRAWSRALDHRDISDDAHHWADDEAESVPMPTNVGEWKASMAAAFEAGRQWEKTR